MPELPDVEVFRRYVNATALHQRIEHVHVESTSILRDTSPQGLGRALNHKSFQSTSRHGKYLFIKVETDQWLVMHFGMSGHVKYFQGKQDIPDYTQILISFVNDHHLAYIAPRKLGFIGLTDKPDTIITAEQLGTDALGLTEKQFMEMAAARRGGAKAWLMDQQTIAGIGNIYSDEILFQAGIHPRMPVSDLDKKALQKLRQAINKVLHTAIDAKVDPQKMPSNFLLPHREEGGHCPNCDGPLETVKTGGRTAWYCPQCQPK
jgi:formamidopyrimidine-DNA glycosylase